MVFDLPVSLSSTVSFKYLEGCYIGKEPAVIEGLMGSNSRKVDTVECLEKYLNMNSLTKEQFFGG